MASSKQEWQEFLDWFEDNRFNLPEWVNDEMSMHECRLLWQKMMARDKLNSNEVIECVPHVQRVTHELD